MTKLKAFLSATLAVVGAYVAVKKFLATMKKDETEEVSAA